MKRLKYYLHQMQNDTTTYKETYDGDMFVELPPKYDALKDEEVSLDPKFHKDTTYWHEDNSSLITETIEGVKQTISDILQGNIVKICVWDSNKTHELHTMILNPLTIEQFTPEPHFC